MKPSHLSFAGLLFISLVSCASIDRSALTAKMEAEVQKVVEYSTIGSRLKNLSSFYERMVDQHFSGMTSADRGRLLSILAEYFSREKILRVVVSKMVSDYNQPFIEKYLNFHETQLYSHMSQLEEYARTMTREQREAYDIESISQSRKESIDEIVVKFNIPQQDSDIFLMEYIPLLELSNVLQGQDILKNVDSAKDTSESFYLSGTYEELSRRDIGATYAQATDMELAEYARYFISDSALWVYSELRKGLKLGFDQCLKEAIAYVGAT